MNETLAALLRSVPTIRALTGRLGTFNDAWWERFADELTARGVRVGDEGLRSEIERLCVSWQTAVPVDILRAVLAATPTPPEIDVERLTRAMFAVWRGGTDETLTQVAKPHPLLADRIAAAYKEQG